MEFFNSAVDVLKTLVVALGAGLGVWGAVNLMEGYGGDNPSAKSQGMKQLMAGGGVALIGITPDPPAERSVRLKTAGGICRPYILLQLTVANGFCTCGANFQAIRSIKKEMFL